jgi:transposase
MAAITSLRLRQQLVHAYNSGLVKTYAETAEMFGVGEATVSRLLRQFRETQNLEPSATRGHRPRAIDDEWLLRHAADYPDALLRERVIAWFEESGKTVHLSTMALSMQRIGWTHKKRRRPPASGTAPTSSNE